ncbi:methyl-accepting chemotaxis protein [Pseudomonadota bacterium]
MSLTIKAKLYILGGLVALAMVFTGLFQLYSTHEVSSANHVLYKVTEIERDMLMLRRNEKDFLARKDLKYAGQFDKNMGALQIKVDQLAGQLGDLGLDITQADMLHSDLSEYQTHFLHVLGIQKKIGLNPKDGLYGALRNAVHSAEESIKALEDDRLLADMLMLRRREKDFMLRNDLKYLGKFDKDIGIFSQHLAASNIPITAKQAITHHMDKYQADFYALVQARKELGLTPKDGHMGEMRGAIHKTEEQLAKLVKEVNTAIKARTQMLTNIAIAISILIILLTLGTIFLIQQSISRRAKTLADLIKQAETNRDLSVRINLQGQDELASMGRSFNQMMKTFEDVVSQVTGAASKVISTSDDLSNTTEQTCQSVTNQQSMTEQVATAMTEMAATVQEVAKHSAEAAEASQIADEEAAKGRSVVNQTITGIQQLAQEVERTASALSELEKESENIGTVLTVIQGIAEQTNLLALNAAIEAARAGDSGRGFAVVADEVRSLAQRSHESTQEIQAIIDRLQSGAQAAVKAMDLGRSQAQVRVEEAEAAGVSLDAIANAVTSISDMNIQIASAVEEQSVVAEEISATVVNIAGISSEAVDASHKTTETGSDLAGLAMQLQQTVGQFQLASGGAELDLSKAKTAHRAWKTRLRAFLDGKEALSIEQAVSHKHCILGEWYYSEGLQKYGHINEMKEMEEPHAELHHMIREIISLKEQGNFRDAEAIYTQVPALSEKIIYLLDEVERKASQ